MATSKNDETRWHEAEAAAHLLSRLLAVENRHKDMESLPYWFLLGYTVARLERITRALAQRYAAEDGADSD